MSYEKSNTAITSRLERERELSMQLLLERYCSDPALAVERLVAAHSDADEEEYETIRNWLRTMDIEIEITRPMVPKGRRSAGKRFRVGSASHQAKLSEQSVRLIRASEKNPDDLAEEFGVSVSTIRSVKSGRSWGHVE